MSELLSHIQSVEDLRKLSVEELPQLCDELRQFIIEQTSKHPGHLGSSLGVVKSATTAPSPTHTITATTAALQDFPAATEFSSARTAQVTRTAS